MAGIDQHPAARGGGQPLGEIPPQGHRSQALVQHHEIRSAAIRSRNPAIFDAAIRQREQRGFRQPTQTGSSGSARTDRSLKRWILPVAVFGSSSMNSIHRGYL